MADDIRDSWTEAPSSEGPTPPPSRRLWGLGRRGAVVAAFTGLTAGGFIGGLVITHAASTPTPSATASPGAPGTHQGPGGGRHGGAPGAQTEDMQLVAGVIGISVGDLQSALSGGRTIAQVAQAHNVSVDKVISAWTDSENQEIDAQVKSGRLSQAEADQEKATTRQRVTDEVNGTGRGPGGPGGPHRGPGGPGLQDEDASVVAGVIGITPAQLRTELSGGRTIAQVAQAHNVSVDKVISAWTDSENQEIDARVKSGRLTQAQADQQKATTRQRVTDEVNGTGHGPGGPHGPHGGPGFGPGGPGAPSGSSAGA